MAFSSPERRDAATRGIPESMQAVSFSAQQLTPDRSAFSGQPRFGNGSGYYAGATQDRYGMPYQLNEYGFPCDPFGQPIPLDSTGNPISDSSGNYYADVNGVGNDTFTPSTPSYPSPYPTPDYGGNPFQSPSNSSLSQWANTGDYSQPNAGYIQPGGHNPAMDNWVNGNNAQSSSPWINGQTDNSLSNWASGGGGYQSFPNQNYTAGPMGADGGGGD